MTAKFQEETVRKVADLARLQLTEAELGQFTAQLGNILGYIEKLNQLDTSKVEPMTHALDLATPTRPDVVQPSTGAQAITESAPESLYENYKVPQVLGSGS
ncbi:MAG: Asp-tRNA(Asn)/Glu-tRNA(Gln) amidotransferase subunit GatC [Bdellovibrionota bacterium]